MKIGFPNNPRKDIYSEIEWIGKNGFDFVDLFLEEDSAVPEKIDVNKLKNVLKKYNLETVGHTAWYLPTGMSIKSVREACLPEVERYFKIFSQVGTKYVTIHANWPNGMFSLEEGIEFQTETLKKIIALGKKYKLNIMYEPIDTSSDTVEAIESILKKVPGLNLHIDIGHSNVHGKKAVDVIKKLGNKIKHIHMHDNNGKEDLHLPIGAGNINWPELIAEIKKRYNGTITLEIFSRDKDLVLFSKKKLEK